MDGPSFDNLVRRLLQRDTSRRALRLGALPILGGVLGVTLAGDADAKSKKKCKQKKKKACTGKCGPVTYKCKKKKPKTVDCGPCPTSCDVCATGCTFSTVQAAINAAAPGDTINICAGTFAENLRIDRNLTLAGAGQGVTILDGKATNSVIAVDPGLTAVTIRDLTITNGKSPGVGGGISNGTAQTTLSNVRISGNEADNRGGGLDINGGGHVNLVNSTISDNHANSHGGGVFYYGTMSCSGSSITGNTAGVNPNCGNYGPGPTCDACG